MNVEETCSVRSLVRHIGHWLYLLGIVVAVVFVVAATAFAMVATAVSVMVAGMSNYEGAGGKGGCQASRARCAWSSACAGTGGGGLAESHSLG